MNITPLLVLLLTAVPSDTRPLGELVLDLGPGAVVEPDVCPVWGEYRVRITSNDPQIASRIQAVRHPAVRDVAVIGRGEGSVVALFNLQPDVLWVDASQDADGRLTLLLAGNPDDTPTPTLAEVASMAVAGRTKAVSSEEMGFMPLGEGSPWSFVSFPLYPPVVEAFLPVSESMTGKPAELEIGIPPTADLLAGLEVRTSAIAEGGAWWFEAADHFVLAASTLADDATHEGALALAGEALYLCGGNDEAFEYFDRAISAFPGSPRTGWYLLGRGLASQGMSRHEAAIRDFEDAAALLPSESRGLPLAALVASLASADRWDAAFELSRTLRRGWPRTHLDPWLEAELAYRAEDPEITRQLLEALQEKDDPRRPLALVRLADCAWLADDSEAFLYWLSSARASGDSTAAVMAQLRRLEWQVLGGEQVSYPTVLAELRSLAAIEPRARLEVALAEGMFLHNDNMLLDACRSDRDTLRSFGSFPAAAQVEARMCGAASELMEVAHIEGDRVFEAGVFLDFIDRRQVPECIDPDLLSRGADVLESLGLWEEARRSLSVLMVHEDLTPPQRERVVLRLGRIYLVSGRLEDGLRSVKYYRDSLSSRTLKLEADLLEAELVLARGGPGDLDGARELADGVLRDSSEPELRRIALRVVGRACIEQETWALASDALAGSRALAPQDDDDQHRDGLLLGWALVQRGDAEEAVRVLEGIDPQRLAPVTRGAYAYISARALRGSGEDAAAEERLSDRALLDENNPWFDLSGRELGDLAWEHRYQALVSVPGPSGPPAEIPSEL